MLYFFLLTLRKVAWWGLKELYLSFSTMYVVGRRVIFSVMCTVNAERLSLVPFHDYGENRVFIGIPDSKLRIGIFFLILCYCGLTWN